MLVKEKPIIFFNSQLFTMSKRLLFNFHFCTFLRPEKKKKKEERDKNVNLAFGSMVMN